MDIDIDPNTNSNTSSNTQPSLPSVLPSRPGFQDYTTTAEHLEHGMVGRVTTPAETPIFICTLNNCYRLYPSRERLLNHRRREHDTDDAVNNVLTWNE